MKLSRIILVLPLVFSCLLGHTMAQRKPNPAMEQIDDQPDLPRVLLIGDSISIGYTVAVRTELEGRANVHRPPTNCSSTRTGVAKLKEWLGEKPWDVIHFNFGLHDLKYVVGDKQQLVAIGTQGSHKQVPIDEYEENLRKIVELLKKSDAKLIWCSTTPVPKGAKGRIPQDAKTYNAVAAKVMKEADVSTDDLFAFAEPKAKEIQRPRDVHYTPEGSKTLAKQVAKTIAAALENE